MIIHTIVVSKYMYLTAEYRQVLAMPKRNFGSYYRSFHFFDPKDMNTLKVDIFACINFAYLYKKDNFACIKIRVLSIFDSSGYYKSNLQSVHFFHRYLRYANYAKICTTRKYLRSQHVISYIKFIYSRVIHI